MNLLLDGMHLYYVMMTYGWVASRLELLWIDFYRQWALLVITHNNYHHKTLLGNE